MTDSTRPQSAVLQKLEALRLGLQQMESVLVCFSGGIDSALVLAVAHEQLGDRAVGMTAVSPSLPQKELAATEEIARLLGVRHELVFSNELAREGYRNNGPDRCFHCKTELYTLAAERLSQWGLRVMLNGTNIDDLGDYRPGLDAAREAGARSPLVEASINKAEVREMSALLGLPIWDKPASACLSSRIPYGSSVTEEKLRQIEALERFLQDAGFPQVRVRHHGQVARIEVPAADLARLVAPDLARRLTSEGQKLGFQFVTADLMGYRTGSLNEVLPGRRLRVLSDQAPGSAGV